MAKEAKKDPQELTVEQKLKALFQLQTMLSKIDEIKTLRGELPLEVQDLEDEIAGLSTRIDRIKAEVAELKSSIAGKKVEIETAKASVAKYKDQQDNVRNNREFDAITKEIEYQELEIELAEKRLKEYAAVIKQKKAQLEDAEAVVADRTIDLNDKKSELESIEAETADQIAALTEKAEKAKTRIDERLLAAYERIRHSVRNGLAVVTVKRDACSGCFNHIPPQRQADIRLGKKLIVCEYCGRILVDDPEVHE